MRHNGVYVVNAHIDRGKRKLNRYAYNALRGFLWNNWLQIKISSFPRFIVDDILFDIFN